MKQLSTQSTSVRSLWIASKSQKKYSVQRVQGIRWADVAIQVGLSKEWVTAAYLNQMTLRQNRQANPNGDRVRITLSGEYLPYKQY